MRTANSILLRVLGLLLLTAAVLKGWQLLTEPVANNDIWSYRPFLIFTVEFELALALWLLSGLFKKAAWLASLLCFSFFSAVTLYKAITGFASCGCFGSVHVNPWITLFAIDLPATVALILFRPGLSLKPVLSFVRRKASIKDIIAEFLAPLPRGYHFVFTTLLIVATLSVSTPILALNEPAMITSTYEVLEPETWVGKKLPIFEYIDIADQLKHGTWLVLFYHYDCPGCGKVIPQYEQMARDLAGNEDFLKIAMIAIPPYGKAPISQNTPCTLGKLAETKEWFITTPAVALLKDGLATLAWEKEAPDFDTILETMTNPIKTAAKDIFVSTNYKPYSL